MDAQTVHRRRWWILGVMCLSLILVVLGNSVLNVALPTLATELEATNTELQWIIDAYALVFGGLLLTMGALGDRFGRRGALLAGLAIVGVASVAATFAVTSTHLIVARAAMGIGAALVMPATLSIISHVFPPGERGKAMGIWAAFAGLGGAVGPVVGGALLESFPWAAIFWLNLPVVALAILGTIMVVPTSRDPHQHRLDLVGAGLSILALASLLYGIIEGPSKGWSSTEVMAAFALAAVSWPLFIIWELRAKHPMLPMQLFGRRGFTTGNAAISLAFFVMFAFFFGMTQYLQFVRDYSALQAGIRTLPLAAGLIMAAPRSDALVKRIGTPGTVTAGLLLVALSCLGLSFIGMTTPYWPMALGFLGLGLGMGFTMAPATTLIMDDVPGHKAGVGSAMNDTSREVGGAFGIAILGSIINETYQRNLVVPDGLAGGALDPTASLGNALALGKMMGSQALIDSARLAFVDGLTLAYMIGAAVALATAVIVRLWMPRRVKQAVPAAEHEAVVETRPSQSPMMVAEASDRLDDRIAAMRARVDRLLSE